MVSSPGRITLWGIEVFVATAEERSITAAARRLGASASAVSQQVTNLEAALGATLLDRAARPLALTPAGEMFRRRAQVMLDEAEQARAELAMNDLSRLTRFRLGMIEDFEADVTPQLLTHLSDRLQGCRFLLETGASHFLLDQLDARALDVAVAAQTASPPEALETHLLLRETFVLAAPRGRLHAGGDMGAQLAGLPLIHYTQRHLMGRQIAAHLAAERVSLANRLELDSYHAILAMVGQGAGWTILTPLALMRARRYGTQIDVFPLPFAPLTRTIALYARRDLLGDLPGQVAAGLKPILLDTVIGPAIAAYPFLRDGLRLL